MLQVNSSHIETILPHRQYRQFSINNIFKPTKATCDGEVIDIKDALEYYDDFLQGVETYWESDNYYSKIDSIITKYPLLTADWIATYYNTKIN